MKCMILFASLTCFYFGLSFDGYTQAPKKQRQTQSVTKPPSTPATRPRQITKPTIDLQSSQEINRDLLLAASKGQTDKVNALIAKGANVNARHGNNGEVVTALMAASNFGHKSTVEALIAKEVDVNAAAKDGYTPLMFAAYNNHISVVRVLIDKGANPAAQSSTGHSAAMYAFLSNPDLAREMMGKDPRAAETIRGQSDFGLATNLLSMRSPEKILREADPDLATLSEQPIRVEATAGFTETKVKIRSGQRISIIASGEIDIGNGQRSGPDGTSISDDKKPAKNCPTGSLFAVVGDDNDDFICIGKAREFIASRDGYLYMSINENNLKDNSGAFMVQVKVITKP